MNSVGGVATERRLPSQQTQHQQFHHHHQPPFYQQHQHSNFLSNATIIDESQFPSLGAKGTSSLGGGFSPIPTTSGGVLNVAQSSPSRQDYRTNYGGFCVAKKFMRL
ncbi:hypothetical protein B9Z55_004429 [Caenorhabditis nigoni]|uniref:Uncharacterized protein n=1 Tax=Caenorhabditis nigoni TaxID=1611254 RepID=A0A2G5UWH0_9PELO|nr:hypothetical protein B9Z55_004429 [Caenorhabditis nigoni]